MSIQSVGATPQIHQMKEHDAPLSHADWKTHSLVVLSYLLVGIGIALACASPYIALIAHPMIAYFTPAVMIATGVLGGIRATNSEASDRSVGAPVTHPKSPFLGLERKGNNCWLNAALLLVFNTPALKKRLEKYPFWKTGLGPVKDIAHRYENKDPTINTQKIRRWLSTKVPGLDPTSRTQDEPWQFLLYFLDQIASQLPTQTTKIISQEGDAAPLVKTSKENPIFFELGIYYYEAKSLDQAFDLYFNESLNPRDKALRFFAKTPEDLSIRFMPKDTIGKAKKQFHMPMQWEAKERHFGGKAQYICDAFLYHRGDSTEAGHWVTCLYKDGQWWEIDDKNSTPLSREVAQRRLNDSPWVHYQKS